MWLIYALLSAIFAAAASILAKVGIEGVNSNLATAIRTVVVRLLAGRQVLTEIDRFFSPADTTKKKVPRWEESRFPKNYYDFLCAHEMADDAHFCIIANPEEISLESLVALIQDVCCEKNIPLIIDQSVFGK